MRRYEPFDELSRPAQAVVEGEIVLFGPGGVLALQVVAVRGDKAWVCDLDDGRHGVVDVAAFRSFGLDAPGTLQ